MVRPGQDGAIVALAPGGGCAELPRARQALERLRLRAAVALDLTLQIGGQPAAGARLIVATPVAVSAGYALDVLLDSRVPDRSSRRSGRENREQH